ncbi:MAG: hypothetical protein ACTHJ7_10215 [Candidatus Nitrosocosmicus sp.]
MKIRKAKGPNFPAFFILVISHIRVYLHLPYRQAEEISKQLKERIFRPSMLFTGIQKNKQTVPISICFLNYIS